MYRVPLIYVFKMTHITFKRDYHQVISISCYQEALVEALLRLQVFAFVFFGSKIFMYLKEILWVRAVTFATPNHITLGEGFLSLIKFEHKSHTPLLFGFSHSMHGTFQVMNFPTYMELRMFESCFHMVLYFKGWITPPLHPGNSVV